MLNVAVVVDLLRFKNFSFSGSRFLFHLFFLTTLFPRRCTKHCDILVLLVLQKFGGRSHRLNWNQFVLVMFFVFVLFEQSCWAHKPPLTC